MNYRSMRRVVDSKYDGRTSTAPMKMDRTLSHITLFRHPVTSEYILHGQ